MWGRPCASGQTMNVWVENRHATRRIKASFTLVISVGHPPPSPFHKVEVRYVQAATRRVSVPIEARLRAEFFSTSVRLGVQVAFSFPGFQMPTRENAARRTGQPEGHQRFVGRACGRSRRAVRREFGRDSCKPLRQNRASSIRPFFTASGCAQLGPGAQASQHLPSRLCLQRPPPVDIRLKSTTESQLACELGSSRCAVQWALWRSRLTNEWSASA